MEKENNKRDLKEKNDIFIVKVTGTNSRTINIPDTVCEFCDINSGDIIKLKILGIKSETKEKSKIPSSSASTRSVERKKKNEKSG